MHPERSLIALLLPGAVFCALAAIEQYRTGFRPSLRLLGWQFPTLLVYALILLMGWFVLGLLATQMIRRALKS